MRGGCNSLPRTYFVSWASPRGAQSTRFTCEHAEKRGFCKASARLVLVDRVCVGGWFGPILFAYGSYGSMQVDYRAVVYTGCLQFRYIAFPSF